MLRQLTLLTIALPLSIGIAHAKSAPTVQEQNQFAGYSLLSYLSYQAMNNYQNGLSQSQNKSRLTQEFAPTFNQAFGQGSSTVLIDKTIETVYTQPQGKTAKEKENYAMLLAYGTLQGCADEIGLDLSNFKK